jgi:type VI secretion system protein ImpA
MRRPQGRDQRREDAAVDNGEAPAPGREDLIRLAGDAATRQTLRERRRQLREIVNDWARLDALIDDRLGNEAPSLARVGEVLRQLGHALTSLLGGQGEHLPEDDDAQVEEVSAPEALPDAVEQSEPQDASVASMTLASASAPGSAQAPTGQTVMNRESAYRQLEQIAEFLQRTEPHSPIPYLVRRAITWGRMPLPQLMQEMLKQEGDVQRLFGLLGVTMDSE